MKTGVTTFLHSGSIGDCWASIPAMKEYHRKTGNKVLLYLTNGQAAFYYEGATHPTKNSDGVQVMLNESMIKMMIPLFKVQPFIHDVKIHNGEPIGINLNRIRETFVNMPSHPLQHWYFYVFPDLTCDITKPYIDVPETKNNFAIGKVIVARTERYQNTIIDYSFLKEYQNDIIFSGTDLEYRLFTARFYLDIPRLKIDNFLELAQAVKQSRGLISNQTQIFQLAEGTKSPRAVELCRFAPNVIAMGENAFEFYAQEALEYFFHTLNGTLNVYLESKKPKKLPAKGASNKIKH